jgi:hypothetical protein
MQAFRLPTHASLHPRAAAILAGTFGAFYQDQVADTDDDVQVKASALQARLRGLLLQSRYCFWEC